MLRVMGCRSPRCWHLHPTQSSSASAIFRLPVPNSCTWGSWTIMLALILLLVDEQRRLEPLPIMVASAFTLSITVTNWMAVSSTAMARWPLKQARSNCRSTPSVSWCSYGVLRSSSSHPPSFFIGSRSKPIGSTIHNRDRCSTKRFVLRCIRWSPRIYDSWTMTGISSIEDSFRLSQHSPFSSRRQAQEVRLVS